MIIEKIAGNINELDEDVIIDRVILDHDDMSRTHQRVVTENGEKIAVSLDRGERLFCGAVLLRDGKRAVVVDMPEEDVLEVRPVSGRQWAKAAFNIGNMHQQAYIYDDCMLVPYDAVLEKPDQSHRCAVYQGKKEAGRGKSRPHRGRASSPSSRT